MLRMLPMLAYLALVVYAIVDVVQSDEEDGGGLGKGLWIFVILLLPFAGSVAWLVVSRRARATRRSASASGFPAGPVPPAQYPRRQRSWEAEVVPADADDDPELRWLMEQARLKREREQAAPDGARPTDDDVRGAAAN
jgi:uncharacterized membrane protein